jgi:hypothetical protein
VEAREGEELRLVVPPLDLHGARPIGGELETAAGDVLGRRGAGAPVEREGLTGAQAVQAPTSKGRRGAGPRR